MAAAHRENEVPVRRTDLSQWANNSLVSPIARESFVRWSKLAANEVQPIHLSSFYLSILDVLKAHHLVCDYFIEEGEGIGGIGPRDLGLLSSAVSRQWTAYSGHSKWQTDYQRCATLFYGIIKNHPFHDASKRTAFLVAVYFLLCMGRVPSERHKKYEELTIRVAENSLEWYPAYQKYRKSPDADVLFIADYLKRKTRHQDKTTHIVTYRQLDKILRRFGFRLDYPSGNFIHVVGEKEEPRFLGWGRRRQEYHVKKIGFPGWRKQVGKKVLHEVRRATELTAENGVDSRVFFEGAEPLETLIPQYHDILKRLRDK